MKCAINKFKNILITCILAAGMLFPAACSSCRPVLYPNAHYKKVGHEQAEKDVQTAIDMARKDGLDDSSGTHRQLAKAGTKTAANTGVNTAVSAASGSAGAGTAIGAASGGVSFLIDWMFAQKTPEPLFRKHVELTLRQQGYQVIGWK